MRSLIRLALVAIIAIIGYNYFYGTAEEKAQSKEIVDEVADSGKKLFHSIGKLLQSEKEKFNNGKYDEAMGELKNIFANMKERANTEGSDIKRELEDLEQRRSDLEDDIEQNAGKQNTQKNKQLKDEFEKLTEAAQILLEKMGSSK